MLVVSLFFSLTAPILQQQTLDRSAFDTGNTASHKAQFKTPEPAAAHPATPDPSHSPATGISSQGGSEENKGQKQRGIGQKILLKGFQTVVS